MTSRMRLLGLIYVGLAMIGCVDSSGGKKIANLVPVTGTVKLDGAPVKEGTISFASDDPNGQPATGKIKDGKFTMVTTISAPGVVAGEYKVRIAGKESAPASPTDKKSSDAAGGIPAKYGDVKTSDLKASVKAGMAPLDFDLKSK